MSLFVNYRKVDFDLFLLYTIFRSLEPYFCLPALSNLLRFLLLLVWIPLITYTQLGNR